MPVKEFLHEIVATLRFSPCSNHPARFFIMEHLTVPSGTVPSDIMLHDIDYSTLRGSPTVAIPPLGSSAGAPSTSYGVLSPLPLVREVTPWFPRLCGVQNTHQNGLSTCSMLSVQKYVYYLERIQSKHVLVSRYRLNPPSAGVPPCGGSVLVETRGHDINTKRDASGNSRV